MVTMRESVLFRLNAGLNELRPAFLVYKHLQPMRFKIEISKIPTSDITRNTPEGTLSDP